MSPRTRKTNGSQYSGHGCPDEDALLDYVDRELPASVAASVRVHAADCARCRELIESEDRLNRAIRSAFETETEPACPTAEQLAAYADAGLTEAERAGVQEHLERCEECRAQLEMMREIGGAREQDLSAPPKEFSEAALSAVSPVRKCLDRLRELLAKRVQVQTKINAVPDWIEREPDRFGRTVVTLVLVPLAISFDTGNHGSVPMLLAWN